MNGVHDIGGMHGFGRVEPEEKEPVFHEAWEGRAYAMRQILAEKYPSDVPGLSRHIIETMEPLRYLQAGYYERFLEVAEKRALDEGLVTPQEIEQRLREMENGVASVARSADSQEKARILNRLFHNQPRPGETAVPPRFAVGDRVRARNLNWPGHNRLPRYIRSKQGRVWRVNGAYRIEDAHAEKLGENPQHVYTVEFAGAEVWGPESEENLKVHMELWEAYLEEA